MEQSNAASAPERNRERVDTHDQLQRSQAFFRRKKGRRVIKSEIFHHRLSLNQILLFFSQHVHFFKIFHRVYQRMWCTRQHSRGTLLEKRTPRNKSQFLRFYSNPSILNGGRVIFDVPTSPLFSGKRSCPFLYMCRKIHIGEMREASIDLSDR